MKHTKRTATRPYQTLREWREAHGLTQAEAARLLDVATISYQKYEHGLRHPRPEPLKRILKLTGVSVEILMGAA